MKPNQKVVTGLAWYREDQYPMLLALSEDRDELRPTYSEWLRDAERLVLQLRFEGMSVQRVDVDVLELQVWCSARGRPINGASRAEFTTSKL